MTTATKTVRDLTWRSANLLRSFFQPHVPSAPVDPLHCAVPRLRNAEIACVYYARRVAGDYYELLRVSPSRTLFALLDVAGRRTDTREVLVAVQKTFRTRAPKLFGRHDFNESEAMIELCHEINLTVLRLSGGVRSCPGFIGCYNETLGTICYANAGHTPGLLQDVMGIMKLEATGLPLGLFSHVTHGASTCALPAGGVFLIVSRGLLEVECGTEEFGLSRAIQSLQHASYSTAPELCLALLEAARRFAKNLPSENDLTALALLRPPMRSTARETAAIG